MRPDRAEYLAPRTADRHCRIHKQELDGVGWCSVGQAWWEPRFRCPHCAGPLWDNGYCENCTPKTNQFPGDYFEQRWDEPAGREWGHYVRVHRGPTPAVAPEVVAEMLTALRQTLRKRLLVDTRKLDHAFRRHQDPKMGKDAGSGPIVPPSPPGGPQDRNLGPLRGDKTAWEPPEVPY